MSDNNKAAWIPSGGLSGNLLLRGDGFFISYASSAGLRRLGALGSDNGSDETALCKDGKYHILNGDFRAAYERLVPEGFEACKKFYDQQSAHADSSWSSVTP